MHKIRVCWSESTTDVRVPRYCIFSRRDFQNTGESRYHQLNANFNRNCFTGLKVIVRE
jgi:hypothetical protein